MALRLSGQSVRCRMANPNGNPDNLIPNSERSPDELREQTRKGGIASGEARREKRKFAQMYADFLIEEHKVQLNNEEQKLTGRQLLNKVVKNILMKSNSASVSMIKEMREATEGMAEQNINVSMIDPQQTERDIKALVGLE